MSVSYSRLMTVTIMTMLSACVTPLNTSRTDAAQGAETIIVSVGPCFGFCPVYDVTVSPNGRIRFVGKRNTAVLGERTRDAGRTAFRLLTNDLARFRPATGSATAVECEAAVSDTSAYTLTWTNAGGISTTATVQSSCPGGAGQDLVTLLRALPAHLGIGAWATQMTRPGGHRG